MNSSAETSPRLPIFATVGGAYSAVFSRPWRLFMAMLLPLLLMLAIWLAVLPWKRLPVWFGGIAPFVDVLPFVFFGLIWFRLLLARPSEGALPSPLFGPRSLAYFWYSVFIYLLFLLPFIVIVIPVVAALIDVLEAEAPELPGLQLLLYSAVPAILLVWSYLLVRLSLLLPAAATDKTFAISSAWRTTSDNGLRLLASYFLVALPVFVVLGGLVGFALFRGHWGPIAWENGGIPLHVSFLERAATDIATAVMRLIGVALLASVAAASFRLLVLKNHRDDILERFE